MVFCSSGCGREDRFDRDGFWLLVGMGGVSFAVGITRIGLSLGHATIMGINIAVGSTIPMIRRWEEVPADAKAVIILGILVCIMGVAVCG